MMKNILRIFLPVLVPALLIAGGLSQIAKAEGANLFVNPSVETGTTIPDGWQSNTWGGTVANFSYRKAVGADGTIRSVYTKLTTVGSGDAKWYPNDVNVTPNTSCTFSDSYKTNIISDVTAEYTLTDGTKQYVWLGSPAKGTAYKRFSKTFTTPANVASMTVFHSISKLGWINTDSYSLTCAGTQPPVGSDKFNRPLISIEFDDGWKDAHQAGLPIVESFGYKTTQYAVTDTTTYPDYMSVQELQNWSNRGHEIASHGTTHSHLPRLSAPQIDSELIDSKSYLENIVGKPVNLFATPYCEWNQIVQDTARKYYGSMRNCEHTANTKQNFNGYDLKAYIVLSNTTDAEIQSWINDAKASNGWLVIVYHRIRTVTNDAYSTTPTTLTNQLQLVKNSGVPVLKTSDALAEVKSQL